MQDGNNTCSEIDGLIGDSPQSIGLAAVSAIESADRKCVAILQSNYIPWRGYFDIINVVDEFIIFDEVQYTRNDWRNRNKIKSPRGSIWLTIPIEKQSNHQKIVDAKVADPDWGNKHFISIRRNYPAAPVEYLEFLEQLYRDQSFRGLSEINQYFLSAICGLLGIKTKITRSSDYPITRTGRTDRLVDICEQAKAKTYLTGPAARDYIDDTIFEKSNIDIRWMDYSGLLEYKQLYPPFDPAVSIVDLLLNEGPSSRLFIPSLQNGK